MLDIEINDISKVFPSPGRGHEAVRAVDGATLSIAKGEMFFLLGPSGCGKTTLLRILAGFEPPTSGRILFDGQDVTDLPPQKRRLAMVFQNYALWPHMTVEANIGFGPRIAGRSRAVRRELVARMLDTVGMSDRSHHRPAQLSGGQQQRVALARALAAEPAGLLLDEPLSNLDAKLRVRMRGEIRRIVKAAGATAVYVTHDQEEALSMADRIAVMDDGRVVQVGTPTEVYHRPANRFVADFLGEANFLPAVVAGRQGDCLLLDTPAGRILAGSDGALADGVAVTCCIRPERISLGEAATGENRLQGRCTGEVYMGATRRYELALAGEQTLAATILGSSEPATVGDSTYAAFAAADVVVLP